MKFYVGYTPINPKHLCCKTVGYYCFTKSKVGLNPYLQHDGTIQQSTKPDGINYTGWFASIHDLVRVFKANRPNDILIIDTMQWKL